jgi:C-terminal processing protease CtpA/Prc
LRALAPSRPFIFAIFVACASRVGSIGAVLVRSHEGHLTIREAPAGYPAARAGLGPGAEILLIDGRDVRRMSAEQIHLALEGDVGTTVSLTVLHDGQVERLTLTRAPLAGKPAGTTPQR